MEEGLSEASDSSYPFPGKEWKTENSFPSQIFGMRRSGGAVKGMKILFLVPSLLSDLEEQGAFRWWQEEEEFGSRFFETSAAVT